MNLEHTTIPNTVKTCIKELVNKINSTFTNNLIGIYLHGSIPMNCFNPKSSDIDMLVLTKDTLTENQKTKLIAEYNSVKDRCPNKIELNVITEKVLNPFIYPTPCELYLTGEEDSVLTTTDEYEIASSIVILKKYGICLYGQSIETTFPNISRKHYLDSISKDAEWSYKNIMKGPNEGNCLVPMYAVLNFCRVLAFIQNDLILSKKDGAQWGLENLPKDYKSVIREALDEYTKKNSSKKVNCKILKGFAIYANGKIQEALLL